MCILGSDRLLELVKECKIIHPFNKDQLDGDSYVLTVGEDITLQYLQHHNVISYEIVFTPPDLVAHLTAKSRYGRAGLSFLNAAKIHSGFVGRLALELVNLSNERKPITIRKGDPLMHMEFITRQGKPHTYDGPYQFQYMSDSEVGTYLPILGKFKGVFDERKIKEAAKHRVTE